MNYVHGSLLLVAGGQDYPTVGTQATFEVEYQIT